MTDCPTCYGMGIVEFSELLPCPDCKPADHLAERVLFGMPTDDLTARRAARAIRYPE